MRQTACRAPAAQTHLARRAVGSDAAARGRARLDLDDPGGRMLELAIGASQPGAELGRKPLLAPRDWLQVRRPAQLQPVGAGLRGDAAPEAREELVAARDGLGDAVLAVPVPPGRLAGGNPPGHGRDLRTDAVAAADLAALLASAGRGLDGVDPFALEVALHGEPELPALVLNEDGPVEPVGDREADRRRRLVTRGAGGKSREQRARREKSLHANRPRDRSADRPSAASPRPSRRRGRDGNWYEDACAQAPEGL